MTNNLSPEVKKILERLYNLKSFDSVILKAKQAEIDSIEASRSEDKTKAQELIESIEDYTDNYVGRSNSYDSLVTGIDLKELKDTKQLANLEDLFAELSETVKEMQLADDRRSKSEMTLDDLKNKIRQAETNLQELGFQKEDIIRYQNALASYIDRALKLDTGITVGEIHDLLVKLGFEEGSEDIEIAAQLIIFPKTGLIAFDLQPPLVAEEKKSISDVFADTKPEVVVEEPVEERKLEISELLEEEKVEEPIIAEEVAEEQSQNTLDEVLVNLELDPLEFTTRDKELMENNLNAELFAMNMNTIKTSGLYAANERIVYDYPSFLWDKELKVKLEILTGEA